MNLGDLIWGGRSQRPGCVEAAGFFWRLLKPLGQWPRRFAVAHGLDARRLFLRGKPAGGLVCLCRDVDNCPHKTKDGMPVFGRELRKCKVFFAGICLEATMDVAGPSGISQRLLCQAMGKDDEEIRLIQEEHLRGLVARIVGDPEMRSLLEDIGMGRFKLGGLGEGEGP